MDEPKAAPVHVGTDPLYYHRQYQTDLGRSEGGYPLYIVKPGRGRPAVY